MKPNDSLIVLWIYDETPALDEQMKVMKATYEDDMTSRGLLKASFEALPNQGGVPIPNIIDDYCKGKGADYLCLAPSADSTELTSTTTRLVGVSPCNLILCKRVKPPTGVVME